MTPKLCEYEIKVLREANGEHQPDLLWGAAMAVVLKRLRNTGLIARAKITYRATPAGVRYLTELDHD